MSNFLPVKAARLACALILGLPVGATMCDGASGQPSDPAAFPPMGRMILVDGHHVHLYCTGAGKPTVILEEGRGGIATNWAWVQRDIAKTSRVCSYDRPGYGWSDPADTPVDAKNISQQLYALLQAAGERPPYLPVGHSLGGAYARMFAAEHRNDDVVGLVLVDATNPSHLTTASEVGLPPLDQGSFVANFLTSSGMLPVAMKLGLVQTTYDKGWNDLPADVVPAMKAVTAGPRHLKTWMKESASLSDTLNQVHSLGSLGNLSVTVISSDRWVDADAETAAKRAEWNKRQQRNHLAISTNSRFLVIPGADHLSLLSNKEHAGAVAKAVVKMVTDLKRR